MARHELRCPATGALIAAIETDAPPSSGAPLVELAVVEGSAQYRVTVFYPRRRGAGGDNVR